MEPLPATRTTDWACREEYCSTRRAATEELRPDASPSAWHCSKIRSIACTVMHSIRGCSRQSLRQEREECVVGMRSGHGRIITTLSHTDISHCPPVFSSRFASTTSPRCAVPVERAFFYGGASSGSSLSHLDSCRAARRPVVQHKARWQGKHAQRTDGTIARDAAC